MSRGVSGLLGGDGAGRGLGRHLLLDRGHVEVLDLLDDVLQRGLRQRAGLGEDEHALLEGHQGRDGGDVRRRREGLLGLGVDLAEHDALVVTALRRGVVDRGELPTRAAPGRPEVDQDDVVVENGLLEGLRGQVSGSHVSPNGWCGTGIPTQRSSQVTVTVAPRSRSPPSTGIPPARSRDAAIALYATGATAPASVTPRTAPSCEPERAAYCSALSRASAKAASRARRSPSLRSDTSSRTWSTSSALPTADAAASRISPTDSSRRTVTARRCCAVKPTAVPVLSQRWLTPASRVRMSASATPWSRTTAPTLVMPSAAPASAAATSSASCPTRRSRRTTSGETAALPAPLTVTVRLPMGFLSSRPSRSGSGPSSQPT